MFHWTGSSKQALKQKSLEQAIIVSDFVEEVNSFLEYEDEKAHLMLETQTDGYFTNEKLVTQVHKAVTLFES